MTKSNENIDPLVLLKKRPTQPNIKRNEQL
jgi:hypothetical protein